MKTILRAALSACALSLIAGCSKPASEPDPQISYIPYSVDPSPSLWLPSASPSSSRHGDQPLPTGTVSPGAFCASAGSTGYTPTGLVMTCKTASDGKHRWRY